MADLGFGGEGFDADPAKQRVSSVVPAGDYRLVMTESERKATKKNDGFYLECKLQIVGGEFQNRIIFTRYNLWSASESARKIAREQFSELRWAVGVLQAPKDSSELHNKAFIGKVKIKADEGYGEKNELVSCKPAGGPVLETTPAASGNPW